MTKKTKLVWKTEYQARYVGKDAKVRYQFHVDQQGDIKHDTLEALNDAVENYLFNVPGALLGDFSYVRICYQERAPISNLRDKFRDAFKAITQPIPTT